MSFAETCFLLLAVFFAGMAFHKFLVWLENREAPKSRCYQDHLDRINEDLERYKNKTFVDARGVKWETQEFTPEQITEEAMKLREQHPENDPGLKK